MIFLIVGQGLRIKTLYNQNIVNFLTLEIITNILQILRFRIIAKSEGFARFIEEKNKYTLSPILINKGVKRDILKTPKYFI